MAGCGWAQIASTVVSWLLIIIGWFFVSRDHNRRERRKEIRALITDFVSNVRECEEKGLEYWSTPSESERATALSVSIKSAVQSLGAQLGRIQTACRGMSTSQEMIRFRRALTSPPFDSANRPKFDPGSGRLVEISDAACDLADAVEGGFVLYVEDTVVQRVRRWFSKGQR